MERRQEETGDVRGAEKKTGLDWTKESILVSEVSDVNLFLLLPS